MISRSRRLNVRNWLIGSPGISVLFFQQVLEI
jgi:hypothetical protein